MSTKERIELTEEHSSLEAQSIASYEGSTTSSSCSSLTLSDRLLSVVGDEAKGRAVDWVKSGEDRMDDGADERMGLGQSLGGNACMGDLTEGTLEPSRKYLWAMGHRRGSGEKRACSSGEVESTAAMITRAAISSEGEGLGPKGFQRPQTGSG